MSKTSSPSAADGKVLSVSAFGITKSKQSPKRMMIHRREPNRPDDVGIRILFAGICHSDIHHINDDWGDAMFPMVPGHEIIGEVQALGSEVQAFKVGDRVCVGNMCNSCLKCVNCNDNEEQYCLNGGPSWVYNGFDREWNAKTSNQSVFPTGQLTLGGYSEYIVIKERFVLPLPTSIPSRVAAPLLCAGITMWTPLQDHKVGKHSIVAISGIGGLGHLGVKMAKALGAYTLALTRTSWKVRDAIERLGADEALLVNSKNLEKWRGKLDLIISTIPRPFDLDMYLQLLKPKGILHVVGNMEEFTKLTGIHFVFQGRSISSSNVGGLQATRDMLDFCAKHKVYPEVEVISAEDISKAFTNIKNSVVRYRYVIDAKTI